MPLRRAAKPADRSRGGGMFYAAPRPPGAHRTGTVPKPRASESSLPLALASPPTNQTDDDALALAFDELLRVQRARAEDANALVSDLSHHREHRGIEKLLRGASYREQWRVDRENNVLERFRDQEPFCSPEQEQRTERLRSQIRRSLHLFLSSDALGGAKAKRSLDLLHAQQMDRLLRSIDAEDPLEVVRKAVSDARDKFQQLLLGSRDVVDRQRQNDDDHGVVRDVIEPAVPEILDLYENVVDAKAKAQPANAKKTATPRVAEPSAAFVENLHRQRDEADRRAAEGLAQSHWQRTLLLGVVRGYRRRRNAVLLLTQKHQARRIATCCFWRWIYPVRCGFSVIAPLWTSRPPAVKAVTMYVQSNPLDLFSMVQHGILEVFRACGGVGALSKRRDFAVRFGHFAPGGDSSVSGATGVDGLSLKLAEWNCHVAIEKARVARELDLEQQRFASEWARYASRLEKDVLKARLSPEWIPQLDPIGGETFYLNVQTATTSSEHPNRVLLRQLLRKQRVRAEQLYAERRRRLELYTQQLDRESEAFVAQAFARLRAHET